MIVCFASILVYRILVVFSRFGWDTYAEPEPTCCKWYVPFVTGTWHSISKVSVS